MKIFLVPFLLDFILFMVMLRLGDAAGREMKLPDSQAAYIVIAFSVGYMVVCPLAGRVLNARTTKPILLFSIAAILLFSVPLLFTVTFWPTLILVGLLGMAGAVAFNAFQSFARGKTSSGALAITLAKYTFAWSTGIALGFLCGGIIKDVGGPVMLSVLCALACMGVFGMIAVEDPSPQVVSATTADDEEKIGDLPIDLRYIAIGWSLCFAANFVHRPLATFIPKFNGEAEQGAWIAGTLLFALYIAEALSALYMSQRTQWLYRALPLAILQSGICLLLGVMWASPGFAVSLAAMGLLGVLYGFLFFSAVYYVSNAPNSARNVGINEMMVGVGNISSMLVCNWTMRLLGDKLAFYPTTMLFSLLLLAVQLLWLRKAPVRFRRQVTQVVAVEA